MEMTAKLWSGGASGGDDLRSKALGRAPQIATFVLALAVAAQLAFIVVGMTSRRSQPKPPPVAAARAAPTPMDVGGLVNAHLFGDAVVKASTDAANAPVSTMPLVLAGLLATPDPKQGMAIIGDSAASAKVIAVGQQVPGGSQLHSVYSDRAIIDRSGTLESVYLPRNPTAGMAAAPPPPPAQASNEANIERMRRLVSDDPGLIGRVIRPQPVFQGGQMKGFRVYPAGNRQMFARMGLRDADTIIAINGAPLNDKDRAQEIFNTLSSSTDARITIMRNNRQQELVLNLAQLANDVERLGAGGDGMIPMDQAPDAPTGNE